MTKKPNYSSDAINNQTFNTSSTTKLTGNEKSGIEDDYDPFQYRDFINGLGSTGALFHMVKGSLGSGILAMPIAFKNAGLWVGLIGAILIGIFCTHCVQLLVLCSHVLSRRLKKPSLGFAETAEAAFMTGPNSLRKYATPAREVVNISLLVSYYLGDTVYIIFIATNFKQVFDKLMDTDLNIRFMILMLAVVLVPIGSIRPLRYLVPLSLTAIVLLTIGCLFVLYEVFSDLPPLDSRPFFSSWSRIPMFYATMCFSIEGIGTVLPIENAMKTPRHFLGPPWILYFAMTWLVTTYTLIGFFGYLRYGEETEGSVTLNLAYSFQSQVVKVLVAINVLLSYPLLLTVSCESVWSYMQHRVSEANSTRYYYTMRVLLILGTVGLAVTLPNLEPAIGLVGTICYSTLGLLFPSILELVTFWGDKSHMGYCGWKYYKNFLLIVGWMVCLVAGLEASIAEVISIYWP